MSSSDVPATVTVDVKSAWASKINWTQAVAAFAMILTLVSGGKVGMSADQQTAAVVTIGVLCNIVTWIMKTFFTSSVHPASLAAPSVNSTTARMIAFFAIIIVSLILANAALAQQPTKTPPAGLPCLTPPLIDLRASCNAGAPTNATTSQKASIDLWNKIVGAAAPDIAYAIALADNAAGSSAKGITSAAGMRSACLKAIQALNNQSTGAGLTGTDGKALIRPNDPALFTNAEVMMEILDAVQPGGPLWTSCSGAAQLAATSVAAFVNALLAGATGIAALAPIK